MNHCDVVVVGAGPGGLAAAAEASKAGASVTILDQYPRPGGQYLRQAPPEFTRTKAAKGGRAESMRLELIDTLEHANVHLVSDAVVFDASHDRQVAFTVDGRSEEASCEALIFATGGYERPVPFPGWTLPGVFTAGALQAMVSTQGVLPGQRIIVAGCGPLLYAVASLLVESGASVTALVDATNTLTMISDVPKLWRSWQPLLQGAGYIRRLRSAKVPLLSNHAIVRVEGDGRAQRAIIAPLNRDGSPKPGDEQTYEIDAVGVSFGFLPSTELAKLAGCEMHHSRSLGGFVPTHDHDMQTSLPGIYVVGECAGIGGAGIAMAQGRIAGTAAARQLGKLNDLVAEKALRATRRDLEGLERFRDAVAVHSVPPEPLWTFARGDTIVCRCEDITAHEILHAAEASACSAREVKMRTWAGMGPCQGRYCSEAITHLVAFAKNATVADVAQPRARPPVHTVRIGDLANVAPKEDSSTDGR